MIQSKSTDKLIAMKDIISETIESMSKDKMDELEEIKIEWSQISDPDVGPLPNLIIKFIS